MKEKNRSYTLNITSVTPEGQGVSRTESGKVVFTPMCCEGETARIKIIKETTGYLVGKAEEILTPSPYRITPPCPVYRQCGGCSTMHMDYEAEKKNKYNFVTDCLKRIGGWDTTPEYIASPTEYRYRNKAQYPLILQDGEVCVGYYARHSHRVVPHTDCLLQPKNTTEIIKDLLPLLKNFSVYENGEGLLRHIYLRRTRAGEYCVMPVINGTDTKAFSPVAQALKKLHPEIKSFFVNINTENTNVILGEKCVRVLGEDYLTDTLCGKRFLISPLSFWQVNPDAAEMLLYKAKEYASLKEGDVVCDLYCGTGTVGICCSEKNTRLFGIEIIPQAVEDAKSNALANGYGQNDFRFVCEDSGKGIEECKKTFGTPSVVFTDPPRKGMSEKVINDIVASGTEKIVYISCNPATLARDIKMLIEKGYTPVKSAVFDLFPRTSHVETVVLLSR